MTDKRFDQSTRVEEDCLQSRENCERAKMEEEESKEIFSALEANENSLSLTSSRNSRKIFWLLRSSLLLAAAV